MPVRKPRRASLLLKTGQVTSYGSGTGVDDGATQKGMPKSYTVLTAGQFAGTTAIVLNGKTDTHANACVLDNNTGLMWSRSFAGGVGPSSNGALPWTTNANGEGIFAFVAAANAAALAGFSDWRIPNIYELLSITDFEAPNSVPDDTAWPVMSATTYLTANTAPADTTRAISYSFATGGGSLSLKTDVVRFLLVRG